MPRYLDFLGPMQVGANLMANRQNLALQRDRARLEAQKFLEDSLQARQLEEYRTKLLDMQTTSQKRMEDDLALRTKAEQRYSEAAQRLADRQQRTESQQAKFYRTMAGLTPILGQRGAAQAASALSGWMPPQLASDLIAPQQKEQVGDYGTHEMVDLTTGAKTTIKLRTPEDIARYTTPASGVESDIIKGPDGKWIANPNKFSGTSAPGATPPPSASPSRAAPMAPLPVSEIDTGGVTVRRPRQAPVEVPGAEARTSVISSIRRKLYDDRGALRPQWQEEKNFDTLLSNLNLLKRYQSELQQAYE